MDTESALFNDTARPYCHVGATDGEVWDTLRITPVEDSDSVWAGGYAVSAADALFVFDQDYSVGPLVTAANRADLHTWRVFAVLAG
jgi:hypothetical protein